MALDVAVVGLGRFGASLAKTLEQLGANVLGIDSEGERVNGLAAVLTKVVEADATDEMVMRELGLRNFDVVVVAIGGNVAASLLITVMLKELGVKTVISKASSDLHGRALQLAGADRVVFPERDMGVRIAKNLLSPNLLDYIELSREHSIAEITAPQQLVGKSLRQLDLRNRCGVNVIALRRGTRTNLAPRADDVLQEGDILVLVGTNEGLSKLQAR